MAASKFTRKVFMNQDSNFVANIQILPWERETETERNRETDRETDRDRQRDRQTEIETEREIYHFTNVHSKKAFSKNNDKFAFIAFCSAL